MASIDWPNLMQAGIYRLRLLPRDFWALTPAELAVMLGQVTGQAPMSRAQLGALLAAYPDEAKGSDDG